MTSFANARRLLKPDGIFILTVPYVLEGETIEHFPNLRDFIISGDGDDRKLINTTRDGTRETFSELVFHGGAGSTLSRYTFSRKRACCPTSAPLVSRRSRSSPTRVSSTECISGRNGRCLSFRGPKLPFRPPPPRHYQHGSAAGDALGTVSSARPGTGCTSSTEAR